MKALSVCLLVLAVVAVTAGELFPTLDATEGLAVESELAGDSPVRQSQRERQDERATKRASLDVDMAEGGVSMIEGAAHVRTGSHGRSKGRSIPGPSLDRITGATKTYHPNDQMCVICQFLVQRTQLDMAHFNVVAGFVGGKGAAAGGASNAATGGQDAGEKDASFLEIGSSFGENEATDDWKSEDAESAKLMELAARQELAETSEDWDAVSALEAEAHAIHSGEELVDAEDESEEDEESEDESEGEEEESSFSETAASASTANALTSEESAEMEDVIAEVRDERVADGVQKTIDDGMEVTPVLVEAKAEAHSDSDSDSSEDAEFNEQLGSALDKQIDLSSDEESEMSSLLHGEEAKSEFMSPTYNADGKSEALTGENLVTEAETDSEEEDAALLQVSENDGDEESDEAEAEFEAEMEAEDAAEGMVDAVEFIEVASSPSAPRSYARVLHVAEASPVEPVMAEVSGEHAHFTSAGGLATVNRRHRKGPRGVGVANSPRRFRLADALSGRPRWNRFDPTVQPHPNAQRQQAREMWHRLMQMTYDRLEGYCSTRLPEQFTPFCRPMLRRFRVIAEGIRYGDRPNQICMRTRFCPRGSYVRRSPHNVFKHVA